MKLTKEQEVKLREKIMEVCEELKEVSFGCDVQVGYPLGATKNIQAVDAKIIGEDDGYFYTTAWPESAFSKEKFIKIIGHPIQLHHLLRAIFVSTGFRYLIEAGGDFLDNNSGSPKQIGIRYDLTQSFYNQSDELKVWVYNLLIK